MAFLTCSCDISQLASHCLLLLGVFGRQGFHSGFGEVVLCIQGCLQDVQGFLIGGFCGSSILVKYLQKFGCIKEELSLELSIKCCKGSKMIVLNL